MFFWISTKIIWTTFWMLDWLSYNWNLALLHEHHTYNLQLQYSTIKGVFLYWCFKSFMHGPISIRFIKAWKQNMTDALSVFTLHIKFMIEPTCMSCSMKNRPGDIAICSSLQNYLINCTHTTVSTSYNYHTIMSILFKIYFYIHLISVIEFRI